MMRRTFLRTIGAGTFGLYVDNGLTFASQQPAAAPAAPLEIRMRRNYGIGRYYFDPIGLYVPKGQRVLWTALSDGFSVTAYHPDNDNHELRIPERAKPFDSGQVPVRKTFEWTFDVEGTYDFYSRFQEPIGMVGRIVVGSPGGPGERPLGYGSRDGRAPIYRDVVRALELARSQEIVKNKTVPYPVKELERPFPID